MMDSIFSWQTLWYLILVLYIPACIGLVVIVLLQKGKGVGFAGAFGMGGGSDTVFGPRASKSLPQRLTYVMAGLFMVLALVMSLIAGRIGTGVAPATVTETAEDYSGVEGLGAAVEGGEGEAAPVAPATPAAEAPAPAPEAPAPAPEAVVEQPTGEAGPLMPPSVEAPKPAESSPEQGTPPAVPVPPVPPAAPAPATPGAQ